MYISFEQFYWRDKMAYGGNKSTPDMHMRKLSFLGFGVSVSLLFKSIENLNECAHSMWSELILFINKNKQKRLTSGWSFLHGDDSVKWIHCATDFLLSFISLMDDFPSATHNLCW